MSQVNELSQRPSRPGEVEVLEYEPRDSAGLQVARDAEPRPGAGVRRVDPGGERVGGVVLGSEGKQDGDIWVRERNSDEEIKNERSQERSFAGQHFQSQLVGKKERNV